MSAWPAPSLDATHARTCRTHWHVCYTFTDDEDEPKSVDVSGCLTLERASDIVLNGFPGGV